MATPLTPQQLQQLADLYTRIDGLSASAAQSAATNAQNIGNAVNELNRLEAAYRDLMADVSSTRESFANIVDDIKQMDSGVKRATNSFRGLESLSSKLQSHQAGINSLSSKELQILQKKTQDRTIELALAKRKAEQEIIAAEALYNQDQSNNKNKLAYERIRDTISEITSQINEGDSALNTFNEQLQASINKQKLIEKSLGTSGALMKGMSKIPFLGDLPGMSSIVNEVEDEIKRIEETEGRIVSKSEAMKMTFGKMKGVIGNSLTDPLIIVGFLVTQFIDALTKADTATGDLAKDFNITYDAAAGVRNELIEIGNLSGNIALNARALQESMVAVGKSLGSNAMLNQADLETFTELREMAGYTNEELIGIQKLTLATGGNLKDNTKQFLGTVAALNAQNKLTINEKQLLKEVSNTSAAIKLSIGGTTKELAASAFQAKQFGINLEQADKIAESLLDFESSITNELSAELITGKDLNLERARLLALNGDIAGASAEILRQVKGSAEFTKMNRIQQEALAKAVGMSREELAASLVEREALQSIGVKDAAAAKVKFDLLVKEKGYAAAVAELGDEQYANQLKQQSIQERFNKSVEKLKEIFISIAEPVLKMISPIVDILIPAISTIPLLLQPIFDIFNGISGILTGGWDKLNGWTKTMGVIGLAAAGILVVTKSIAFYNGLIQAFGIAQVALERSKKQGILGTIGSMVVALGIQMGILSASMATNAAVTFGIGVAVAVAAALAGIAAIRAVATKPVGDMYSPANGKTQVSTKEGGLFDLSPNDSLFAFPESKIKPSTGRSLSSTTNAGQDLSPLLEEMRAMRQETARSNNKPVIVENSMDGTRFGTAVAMNTYKIQ
jgi:archaellum component FlaC